jgi:hypothetical protein
MSLQPEHLLTLTISGAMPTDVFGRGHVVVGAQHAHEDVGIPPKTNFPTRKFYGRCCRKLRFWAVALDYNHIIRFRQQLLHNRLGFPGTFFFPYPVNRYMILLPFLLNHCLFGALHTKKLVFDQFPHQRAA